MIHEPSPLAIAVFLFFILLVVGLSAWLGRRARSASGYYAAHGEIHWFVNGVAFAGDYLSAASFLGICGMIAFWGYDGFLYSIGYLAGWVVALFIVAEPLKRMGRFTFADALDSRFGSRSIKLAAAISTLVVSLFYLIPQMVGAGALVTPLLGLPHAVGVLIVGVVVTTIVVTAGMVSTTWVQFIKGSLLVLFCLLLTGLILARGLRTSDGSDVPDFAAQPASQVLGRPGVAPIEPTGGWAGKPYVHLRDEGTGRVEVWRQTDDGNLVPTQRVTVTGEGRRLVDGVPQGHGPGEQDLQPVGRPVALPGGVSETGPLGPMAYLRTLQESTIQVWDSERVVEADGAVTTVYYPRLAEGADLLLPGASPTFRGVRSDRLFDKLDFLSLMLALFCGTASLPHILIRYYTVKDEAAVRKSTVVGIGAIGVFYVLTLYLGLGAMTSGALDVTNNNMAAPLLARSFSPLLFAIISAIAFTTVLGTVSGLIIAASGAVAHDLLTNVLKLDLGDAGKVRAGKLVAVGVGAIAMVLGVLFERLNVSFLVGWAFNIAASANLPALVMALFWRRATRQGIAAAILVGMVSSLAWVLLSAQAFRDVYGLPASDALVPFSQPGIVTIPLGFLVLIVVSLLTTPRERTD
ncbi:MAG TPA: cation acetate symporter [Vicinamibacterales bacterium]